eukprot:TRINITY_DN15752_c0_g1_i1.p2 TRINITY_DN15752_c0_g1~~TRINITY_DN15752_c0_g1_i1.p2  ORF type:complete len:279 (+),score=74.43 TRINITY_DN15752_c0_g1_i1:953-1789(+)
MRTLSWVGLLGAWLIGSTLGQTKLQQISDNVWIYATNFNFLSVIPYGNNGMLINTDQGLVAVGAPELSDELMTEVKQLTDELETSIKYVLCTDWHHLFSADWGTNFTDATVYYTGIRGYRFHENVTFNKAILDYNKPAFPGIDESIIKLIPIQGFEGPGAPLFSRLPDETIRTEVAVFLPPTGTLFIYDFVLCSIIHIDTIDGLRYEANFGPAIVDGFETYVQASAQQTVQSFQDLQDSGDVKQLVFAHGDLAHGCYVNDPTEVHNILQNYLLSVSLN